MLKRLKILKLHKKRRRRQRKNHLISALSRLCVTIEPIFQ